MSDSIDPVAGKQVGDPASALASHPALGTLREAAEGLLFPSETDAPLVPFFWADADAVPLTSERLLALAQVPVGTPVKSVSLATFFRPATKEEDWHNAEEQAEVKRFQGLVATIKATLGRPQVFRVGETNMDVYVVGVADGGYMGLQTRVVET